eukprot:14890047-Alexandrium_andersonii.AAC.1
MFAPFVPAFAGVAAARHRGNPAFDRPTPASQLGQARTKPMPEMLSPPPRRGPRRSAPRRTGRARS